MNNGEKCHAEPCAELASVSFQHLDLTDRQFINLNVDKLLTIRTWASRSERLRGEPLAESALSSPSPAGIHLR